MQRMHGKVVLGAVRLDILGAPLPQRCHLDDTARRVEAERPERRARAAGRSAKARDPGVGACESALEGLDLAEAAARVGLAQPELGTLVRGLLGNGAPGPERLDVDAEAIDQAVANLVRLGEEEARLTSTMRTSRAWSRPGAPARWRYAATST